MSERTGGAFRVGDARRAGRSRSWIDGDEFERPFHGIRRSREPEPAGNPFELNLLRTRRAARDWTLHMRRADYFSHVTAACIWGLPLPASVAQDATVHVSSAARALRATGVTGHQVKDELVRVVTHPGSGLRVTDPATTWAMLATTLPHVNDVVAVGDAVIRVPRIPGPRGRIERPALGSME